jgi:hypothetical protein
VYDRRVSRGVAAILVCTLCALPAFAADPAAVRAARDAVYAQGDYQRELPGAQPAGAAETGDETGDSYLPTGGSQIATILVYILIAVSLAVLALWLWSELVSRRGHGARLADEPLPDEDAPRPLPAPLLEDADALARAGRFVEAIHGLLLGTLGELVRRQGSALPASLTAREILSRVTVGVEARSALAALVDATERCWFGAAPASGDDFARCRGRFVAFAQAYGQAAR